MTTRAPIASVTLLGVLMLGAPAEANWGWLEKISGPGPFKAQIPGLVAPIVCIDGADYRPNLLYCRRSNEDPRGYVGFEFQTWKSIENVLFVPDPRASSVQVRIVDFRTNLMIRLHDAFDVGLGAGFHRFSGPSFDAFWRMSVEPARASIAPLMLFGDDEWRRFLKIDVGATRFRGEFTDDDFCTPPACTPGVQTMPFSAEGEYLWRSSVVLDFSAFLRR
jgi:hypothetical protein